MSNIISDLQLNVYSTLLGKSSTKAFEVHQQTNFLLKRSSESVEQPKRESENC